MSPHGQTVLVLQGGGALGAYQGGVYEALHEAGLEPDWVIGTSIGAINGALVAANAPQARLERLREFWARIVQDTPLYGPVLWPGLKVWLGLSTVLRGRFPDDSVCWAGRPASVSRPALLAQHAVWRLES